MRSFQVHLLTNKIDSQGFFPPGFAVLNINNFSGIPALHMHPRDGDGRCKDGLESGVVLRGGGGRVRVWVVNSGYRHSQEYNHLLFVLQVCHQLFRLSLQRWLCCLQCLPLLQTDVKSLGDQVVSFFWQPLDIFLRMPKSGLPTGPKNWRCWLLC